MKKLETWKFVVQVVFSTVVILLCAFQIGLNRDKDNVALYWSGLSGVLAYWLPSPASSSDKEQVVVSGQQMDSEMSNNGLVKRSHTTQQTVALTNTEN